MTISWINIAGRIFASPELSVKYQCYTYPVYKPINSTAFDGAGEPITLVPATDPNYSRLPWAKTGLLGWALALLLGPLVGAAAIGATWSLVAGRRASKRAANAPTPVLAMSTSRVPAVLSVEAR